MLKGFREFIFRGNVVDLAVGIVIGAAFSSVVSSLVKGLITPLIGAIAKVPDFSGLMFTINGSQFAYGEFINALVSFILSAAAVYFFVIVPMTSVAKRVEKRKPEEAPTTKECAECMSTIHIGAKRCAHCGQVV
jgi:large conductance mechanosensitive channel